MEESSLESALAGPDRAEPELMEPEPAHRDVMRVCENHYIISKWKSNYLFNKLFVSNIHVILTKQIKSSIY